MVNRRSQILRNLTFSHFYDIIKYKNEKEAIMDSEKVGQFQQLAKEITSEFYIKLNDGNNSVVLEQKKDNTKVEVAFTNGI